MSWDNYRQWETDHIFPLSKSESQNEYEKNSHYTNLQPLWKKDNRDKSNKLDYVKKYIKYFGYSKPVYGHCYDIPYEFALSKR